MKKSKAKKIDILLKVLVVIGWLVTIRATGIYMPDSSGKGIQIAFAIAMATGMLFLLRYLLFTSPRKVMTDINALFIVCWIIAAISASLMATANNWWSAILIWFFIITGTTAFSAVRVPKYKKLSTC